MNGAITNSENFADNAGVIAAYEAFRTETEPLGGSNQGLPGLNYTVEQLFWISYANVQCTKFRDEKTEREKSLTDKHAPPKSRVNVPLSNIDEFSKDFQCQPGSVMNPVKKCIAF